jgi:osmotically-inducible protein OsmY
VGQAIRQALFSNSTLFNDLRNLRISSSNGIVTASGTVANAQERDRVISILNNISGVRQVNNQIEIRQP